MSREDEIRQEIKFLMTQKEELEQALRDNVDSRARLRLELFELEWAKLPTTDLTREIYDQPLPSGPVNLGK